MENEAKSIWNFDDDRMRALSYKMLMCETFFDCWDITNIYTTLTSIRRILFGAIKEKEQTTLKKLFDELETLKRKLEASKELDLSKNRLQFYNKAEKLYEEINRVNVKNGFYFRRGEDVRFAALKR